MSSVLIILMQVIAYAYVWHTYYAYGDDAPITPFWNRGNYVVIGMYGLMLCLFYRLYGGFKVGYLRFLESLYSQILSVICTNAVSYLQLCLIGNLKFLDHVIPIVYMTVVDIVIVILWGFVFQKVYFKIYPPREIVLVYGRYNPKYLISKIASRKDKYSIAKIMSINEDINEIKAQISHYRCVLLMDTPAETRNELLKFCFENDIRCYSVPKISDIMIKSSEDIHLFDTTLLLMRNRGLTVEQQFFKRLFDIVASLVAIVIASPIMLVIAVCIKAYDGGPVIFTQDRLTKDGAVFRVKKFRSMVVETKDAQYCLTRKRDKRVTPVGKIIRAIHFDELPQLFNILKGEMSFVGPRPECPEIAEKYGQFIPEFSYRLKVKAGLTGFSQVYGKYNTTPYDKLKLDMTYIENYSLRLDIKLMLMTLKILFLKENTEGIESWQVDAILSDEFAKNNK
jgi:exopolysaccharide biosynthesis polyprenyl glycosylphosphotransferase